MTNKKNKLKRLISGFGVGAAATAAIIPVVACGEEDGPTVVLVPESLVNDLRQVTAQLNATNGSVFLSKLPPSPDHSEWQYRVGDGKFSADLPTGAKAGDMLAIKLVADQDYTLESPVERDAIEIYGEIITTGLQDTLNDLTIYEDTKVLTLPAAPGFNNADYEKSLTWWEYQVQGETTWNKTPANFDLSGYTLTVGEKITVRLGVDEGFTISSEPVVREFIVKGQIDTTGFQDYLDNKTTGGEPKPYEDFFYIQPNKELSLFRNPTHTQWEYQLNDSPDWNTLELTDDVSNITLGTFDTTPFNLQPGDSFGLRLNVEENYVSSTGKVAKTFTVVNVIDTAATKAALNELANPLAGANSFALPDISALGKEITWQYSLDAGKTWKEAGTELTPDKLKPNWKQGQKFSLQLHLPDNDRSLSGPIRRDFTIQAKIAIPAALRTALGLTIATSEKGIMNLPNLTTGTTKLDHVHWQFFINDSFIDHQPTPAELKLKDKVTIKLAPNDDTYVLDGSLEVSRVVLELVNVPTAVRDALQKVTVTHDKGLVGVPNITMGATKVDHAHWEYQVNDQQPTTNKPAGDSLNVGDKVKITLVVEPGYVFAQPVTRTVMLTQVYEIPDAETFWNDFRDFELAWPIFPGSNSLPVAEHSHWEYQIGDAEPSPTPPGENVNAGTVVKVTFVADPGWIIAVPEDLQNGREITVQPRNAQQPDAAESDFSQVKATPTGITGLPVGPTSAEGARLARFIYSKDDGATWKNAYLELEPKVGDKVTIQMVPDDYPNQVYATPVKTTVTVVAA